MRPSVPDGTGQRGRSSGAVLKLQRLDRQTPSPVPLRGSSCRTSSRPASAREAVSASTERENKNQEASIADWPVTLFITYSIRDVLHVERCLHNLSAKSNAYSVIAVAAVFHST